VEFAVDDVSPAQPPKSRSTDLYFVIHKYVVLVSYLISTPLHQLVCVNAYTSVTQYVVAYLSDKIRSHGV
jgi:hypothetical protein